MKLQASSTLLAMCIGISALTPAMAEEHAPIPLPSVAAGDSWTYQYTDVWKHLPGALNRLEVTAIDDAGIHVDIKRAANGQLIGRQLFNREMNPVQRGKMRFAPAFARYAFPLEPGKEWKSDVSGENPAAGKRWHYQFNGKALGWEKIKVQAGEFDAMKIELTAYYRGEEVGSNGGNGQLNETVWFAPAVNNFVKLEYRDTDWTGRIFNRDEWELAAYSKK